MSDPIVLIVHTRIRISYKLLIKALVYLIIVTTTLIRHLCTIASFLHARFQILINANLDYGFIIKSGNHFPIILQELHKQTRTDVICDSTSPYTVRMFDFWLNKLEMLRMRQL